MLVADRLPLMPAHLTGREGARFSNPLHPVNDRAWRNPELSRRPMTRQTALRYGRYRPFSKIHRIRLPHPARPPIPVVMLNQNEADSGIPPIPPNVIPL